MWSNGSDCPEVSSTQKYQKNLDDISFHTCVGFAMLLAKESGILESLLTAEGPLTSHELANKKNLKERYTREILASLVTAEVVKLSKNEDGVFIYYLGESDKIALKDGNYLPNISMARLYLECYNSIKRCLLFNGPAGIDQPDVVHNLYNEHAFKNDDKHLEFMLENTPGIQDKLGKGIQTLEFASGSTNFLRKLAQRFPYSTFTASDIKPEFVENMKKAWGHLPNINFEAHDLCTLPETPMRKYDLIIVKNALHILPDPLQALKSIRKMLVEPNGTLSVFDFTLNGDIRKTIGNTEIAAAFSFSTFTCLSAALNQREDSEPNGCLWNLGAFVQIAQEAGYEVTVFPVTRFLTMFVAKPI